MKIDAIARRKNEDRKPVLPNAKINIRGIDETAAALVKETLRFEPCIPVSYFNIHGLKLDGEDVLRVEFSQMSWGGEYRSVNKLQTFVFGEGGRGEEELHPLIVKVQKLPRDPEDMRKYQLHQVTGGRYNPVGQQRNVGGLWMMPDTRMLLFLNYLEGVEYHTAVNERSLTPEAKEEIDRAMAYRIIEWWRAEEGYTIKDMHGRNLLLLPGKTPDGKHMVEIIDSGLVQKCDERSLLSKLVIEPTLIPEDLGDESQTIPTSTFRNTIKTKPVVDAAIDVFGRKEAIEFFKRAYNEGPKYGSVITKRFDEQLPNVLPEVFEP